MINAKRMSLLTSLALALTIFGGGLAHAANSTYPGYAPGGSCIPTVGGTYCPLANQAPFQASQIGQESNLISTGNSLSDLGTLIASDLGTILFLILVLIILFYAYDKIYRK